MQAFSHARLQAGRRCIQCWSRIHQNAPFFGSGKAFGSTQARWRARYNGPFIDDASPIAARQDAAEVFSFWVGMCSFWAIRGAAGEISNEVNVRFASTSPRNHLAPTT